jgi:hypothetical protein
MLSLHSAAALAFNGATMPTMQMQKSVADVRMETVKDLEALAEAQQIPMGYWDPLKLAEQNFWNQGNEATIGWIRHAEIKHGRVAMAAFVGFCVQSNGIHFPWDLAGGPLADESARISYASLSELASPADQWDAVPAAGKLQILFTILLLEWVGESLPTHYMRGGQPGFYPSLKEAKNIPHPVPFDLYDPFGLFENDSAEKKARGLNVEINNGRAAMLGIFGLISTSKGLIVPGLDSLPIAPYSGEYMGAFAASDKLPLVDQMLAGPYPWNN